MIKFIKDIHIKSESFSKDNMNQLILMVLKELKININKLTKCFPKINSYEKIKSCSKLDIYYLYFK